MIRDDGTIELGDNHSAYGRRLCAWIERDVCSMCLHTQLCLCTDGSDGEYGGPSFCEGCLEKIINAIKETS